jgi:hypothetical protein
LELFANGSANSPSWLVNVNRNEAQARYLANDSDNAEQLIRTVVGRLSDPQNFQYAGTMWENVATNGTPGLTKKLALRMAGRQAQSVHCLDMFLGYAPLHPDTRIGLCNRTLERCRGQLVKRRHLLVHSL